MIDSDIVSAGYGLVTIRVTISFGAPPAIGLIIGFLLGMPLRLCGLGGISFEIILVLDWFTVVFDYTRGELDTSRGRAII